jgi:outer membrane protein assembly factor BamD (BamD/ComL family)
VFGRANDARHKGDARLAVTLYRTLQQEFPDARESKLSCVLLGRTLLQNEVNDPAGALAQFDAYLASSPSGTLVEEALSGRARALERLLRAREAREAWRLLVDGFPESIYAVHARQQLGSP